MIRNSQNLNSKEGRCSDERSSGAKLRVRVGEQAGHRLKRKEVKNEKVTFGHFDSGCNSNIC